MNFALYVQQSVFKHLASYVGINAIEICLIYIEKMPNKKKARFRCKKVPGGRGTISRSRGRMVIYSSYRLVYNMDECRICRKAQFNAIFLRLR